MPPMSSPLTDLLPVITPDARAGNEITLTGKDPVLSTPFPIAEAAASALATGALAASRLGHHRGLPAQHIRVDLTAAAASLLGFALQRADAAAGLPDASVARASLAMTRLYRAGDYRAGDGRWIHLHGGFPHLRDGLLALLECDDEVDSIARAVERWDAFELEDAVAERGLCAAVARTEAEWAAHPQGRTVAAVPVVEIQRIGDAPPRTLPPATRPLDGVRLLDLTRVLAGPTCGRTLAAHGAEVLRIDGPKLPHIAPFVLDTSHGKRSALLDLRAAGDRARLEGLLADAHVFSQGYRAGALDALGLAPERLAERRPGIVVVSINCYGHSGPWRERRGWEQLAQSASGIAVEQGGADSPALLPAAATDYTTGYLGALGAMAALLRQQEEGGSWHVRVSLARTARWLQDLPRVEGEPSGIGPERIAPFLRSTPYGAGRLHHLGPVVDMSATPPEWRCPTGGVGRHEAVWHSAAG